MVLEKIGKTIDRKIPSFLDELEISRITEELIIKKGEKLIEKGEKSGRFLVAFNELPLFLTSNIEPINKYILNSGGSLEIITPNISGLDKSMIKPKGDVRLYETSKNIKNELAIFYNNVILKMKEDRFFLHRDTIYFKKKYTKVFDNMTQEPFVVKREY